MLIYIPLFPLITIILFDSLNYLEKTSYVPGSELWENNLAFI